MQKLSTLSSTIILICFTALHLNGQAFLNKDKAQAEMSFDQLQLEFYNWSKNHELSQEKGWKYYKRWEDFNVKRTSSGNFLPNARNYYNAIQQMNNMASMKEEFAWTPVGLNTEAEVYDESLESGIGRINCITFHPTDSNTFWVGVAQGGVWKTTDHGHSWVPLTDNLPMLRISDIAVNPNNTDEIYVSVGDYAYVGVGLLLDDRKRNTHYGLGVYKTTDGGLNWQATGLTFEQTDFDASLTRRVFINPDSTNVLLAAGTHGIWKSSDAGDNWTKISDDLIWDIERDPSNPQIIYASTGYINNLQIGQCGIIKSTDFGSTWNVLETGIPPEGEVQRIELAIAPGNTNKVYAVACNITGGLYGFFYSPNGGQDWSLRSTTPNILEWYDGYTYIDRGQGTYDLAILVDPQNENRVFVGGVNLWATEDGGQTWGGVSYWRNDYGKSIHADQHFLNYNALDNYFYICNDGGLYRTKNIEQGSWDDAYNQSNYEWPTQWERLNNGLMVTSFYRIGLSQNNLNYVIGGAQDNSTFFYNTNDWHNIFGGDGMECLVHPDDPNIIYGSSQYGNLFKSTDGGYDYDYISYWEIDEDGEWTTPFVFDPNDPDIIYAGYGNVYKTTNGGDNWQSISNFPVIDGLGQPDLCSSIAISKTDNKIIYVAKRIYHSFGEPGSVYKTSNGGTLWEDITSNLPDSLYFTYLVVDDQNADNAWITLAGFEDGLKVFKTNNGGESWENISRNLPNLPVNCIVEQPGTPQNPVYIGMDAGVYYTNDTMQQWILLNHDLPNVIVSELEIHEESNKIYAATFGRGIWKSDLYVPVVDTTSSAANILYSTLIDLSPNPAVDEFTIRIKTASQVNAKLNIVSVTGAIVYTEDVEINKIYEKTFDQPLSPGQYYVVLNDGKFSRSKKIIVR